MADSHKAAPFFAKFGARATATMQHGWGSSLQRVDMELGPRRRALRESVPPKGRS